MEAQYLEMALKHGMSMLLNVWFMFRIEGVLKDVVSTNAVVISHLSKKDGV